MINYLTKDITTVDRGIIAHGCNCQGVMGSGVARFLRNKYPDIFPRYNKICVEAKLANDEDRLLGDVDFAIVAPNLIIANCFTQHLYGYGGKFARPEAIFTSLAIVYSAAALLGVDNIYIPKIGAGRGGLDWTTEVEPIIEKLSNLDPNINTYVCTWAE